MPAKDNVSVGRTPGQQRYLADSFRQFRDPLDRIFEMAKSGNDQEAHNLIRLSMQARQAGLSTAVARLLVQNNASEEAAAPRTRQLYRGVQLEDVTARAGVNSRHNSRAFGSKYLPETLGPGCAFFDYDGDGWLDIPLVNGSDCRVTIRRVRIRRYIGTIATGRSPM